MALKRHYWNPWVMYTLFVFGIVWIQGVDLAEVNDDSKHGYEALKKYYIKYKDDIKSYDCNVDDPNSADEEHHGWGTLTTLRYLTGEMSKMSHGEKLNNVEKLRVFLARVGYLKVPGSLVFLNRQTETLRLQGCDDNAQWRMQGERGMDNDFYDTGNKLKIQAPNSANYIQKFTCFKLGGCSHTFYVITRPLPEVSLGLQLREGVPMDKDSYSLYCGLPFCNIKQCKVGKTDTIANRRAYPPYTISWSFKSRENNLEDEIAQGEDRVKLLKKVGKDEQLITKENEEVIAKEYKMKVYWDQKVRKSKEDPENEKESYKEVDSNSDLWRDAFGHKHDKNDTCSFHSRIVIDSPTNPMHSGVYECIIEDANGVVSTPSVFPGSRDWKEYRGRTNVYVIDSRQYLTICFGVSLACIVGVGIIILACPKKMEYDDGTPYTKEELVAPAKGQDPESTPGPSPSQHDTVSPSKKSMSPSIKHHTE